MEKILRKDRLGEWVKALKGFDVHAPVFEEGVWDCKKVEAGERIRLDHPFTVHAPKKVVFPQREVLLEFAHAKGVPPEVRATVPEPPPSVVFGVRPCDAKAMTLTDRVFGGGEADPYYQARRTVLTIVGLVCATPPNPSCFCRSVGGSPTGEDGLDALMTDLGERYFVKALSDQGRALMALAKDVFADATPADRTARDTAHAQAEAQPQRKATGVDLKGTPAKLATMFDTPYWAEKAKACIECGICTYLCPTCHCFDINDEVTGASPCQGKRVRSWDTCQFPDFTMHTTGHNPRPGKASHLRQRVCHKFQYFPENNDLFQCTGCGRCTSECPVGIDLVAVMNGVSDYAG